MHFGLFFGHAQFAGDLRYNFVIDQLPLQSPGQSRRDFAAATAVLPGDGNGAHTGSVLLVLTHSCPSHSSLDTRTGRALCVPSLNKNYSLPALTRFLPTALLAMSALVHLLIASGLCAALSLRRKHLLAGRRRHW